MSRPACTPSPLSPASRPVPRPPRASTSPPRPRRAPGGLQGLQRRHFRSSSCVSSFRERGNEALSDLPKDAGSQGGPESNSRVEGRGHGRGRRPPAQDAAQRRFERSPATRPPRGWGCASSGVGAPAPLAPACPRRPPLLPGLGDSGTWCGEARPVGAPPHDAGTRGRGLVWSPGNRVGPACHSAWAPWVVDGAESPLPGGGGCRKSEEVTEEETRSKDPCTRATPTATARDVSQGRAACGQETRTASAAAGAPGGFRKRRQSESG